MKVHVPFMLMKLSHAPASLLFFPIIILLRPIVMLELVFYHVNLLCIIGLINFF